MVTSCGNGDSAREGRSVGPTTRGCGVCVRQGRVIPGGCDPRALPDSASVSTLKSGGSRGAASAITLVLVRLPQHRKLGMWVGAPFENATRRPATPEPRWHRAPGVPPQQVALVDPPVALNRGTCRSRNRRGVCVLIHGSALDVTGRHHWPAACWSPTKPEEIRHAVSNLPMPGRAGRHGFRAQVDRSSSLRGSP
jgi:hypothetical protein